MMNDLIIKTFCFKDNKKPVPKRKRQTKAQLAMAQPVQQVQENIPKEENITKEEPHVEGNKGELD